MDVSSFITFGCWNKKGEALDSVMKELTKFIDHNNINNILVSGDNYYSDDWEPADDDVISVGGGGKKKNKKLNYQDLNAGFKKLYNLNKNIHIGIGNHEIKSVDYIENNEGGKIYLSHEGCSGGAGGEGFNTVMTEFNKEGEHLTKAFEQNICDQLNKDDERLYTYFGEEPETIVGHDLTIVFINTNGQEDEGKEQIRLRPLVDGLSDDSQLADDSPSDDSQSAGSSPPADPSPIPPHDKIVIVGHIPFLYLSRKQKEDFDLGDFIIRKELADEIVSIGSKYNEIYYLCADEHYYMGMEIEYDGKLIHQHIVGTGGTILDCDIETAWGTFFNKCEEERVQYDQEKPLFFEEGSPPIIVKSINPPVVKHGFCHCTVSDDKIQIDFIPAITVMSPSEIPPYGGYMEKRKYKKRSKRSKRKYKKRSQRSKRKYKKRSKRKYKKRSQRSKRKSKKR